MAIIYNKFMYWHNIYVIYIVFTKLFETISEKNTDNLN